MGNIELTDSIFETTKLFIKPYWLLEEIKENKNELNKIKKNSLEEYKAQATLIENVALNKTEFIQARLNNLLKILDEYIDILEKLI